jgi:hypothetical protein
MATPSRAIAIAGRVVSSVHGGDAARRIGAVATRRTSRAGRARAQRRRHCIGRAIIDVPVDTLLGYALAAPDGWQQFALAVDWLMR